LKDRGFLDVNVKHYYLVSVI